MSQGFIETPTPSLVVSPGLEAHLDPLEVKCGQAKFYLPTSPEIHLKKLLCRGFSQIFEIRPCFRNDPATKLHRSEFFMLEWYRTHQGLGDLQQDILGLVKHLKANDFWHPETAAQTVTFKTLFKTYLDFEFTPQTSLEELQNLFKRQQIYFNKEDSKTDLIHRLMIEKFEPHFNGLIFLEEFPPEMAVLSRIGANGFAERFECYFDQVEIANAFNEVTDPKIQHQRWSEDLKERELLKKPPLKMDDELLSLMTSPGMPESAGIALGLDRLFMMGRGLKDISEIGF